jgi:hypothetical protein
MTIKPLIFNEYLTENFYFVKQWAAVRTQDGFITTPPHQCPTCMTFETFS